MKPALAVVVALLAASAVAASGPSAARGKVLFESRSLGTNGKSCVQCHAGGKGFDDVGATKDAELAAYVNSCIKGMLAGKELPAGSDDLRSIVLHVRELAPKAK